jgi:hypothetical protein
MELYVEGVDLKEKRKSKKGVSRERRSKRPRDVLPLSLDFRCRAFLHVSFNFQSNLVPARECVICSRKILPASQFMKKFLVYGQRL